MRILLLADANSSHTIRWAKALSDKGIEVSIFSFTASSSSSKLLYLLTLPRLKKMIHDFKPDIVHAHYASSYGLLGALSGFHPLVISAWGSDIFDFPKKFLITRKILQHNFRKAEILEATSRVMGKEIERYTSKKIHIVPFGIDPDRFSPSENQKPEVTIGVIKSLEKIYGIDWLITAFAGIRKDFPGSSLLIVGDGSLRQQLQDQAEKLGISEKTTFTGKVPYTEVPDWHRKIDIFVNPSLFESFGVSVLEASASGVPVIASDTGGLPEVVEDGLTGFLFPVGNIEKLQQAMVRLLSDAELRKKMGKAGREKVLNQFDLDKCVEDQIEIYRRLVIK